MDSKSKTTILLKKEDRQRLEHFAPFFDVYIVPHSEDEVLLQVLDRGGWRVSRILKERLHIRLLTELCSKTLRWVYYPLGSPCSEALMSLADERIARLAELYEQQKFTLLKITPPMAERPDVSLV